MVVATEGSITQDTGAVRIAEIQKAVIYNEFRQKMYHNLIIERRN